MKESHRRVFKWARPLAVGPVLVGLAALTALACGERDAGVGVVASLPVDERSFTDYSDFVGYYWERPIPLQGTAPEAFSPLEASLQPAVCGNCHAQQYQDWGTTVHAGAYSPGLSGQLVNWESYNYQSVRNCLVCHTPLSEQSARVPDTSGALVPNPYFDATLQGRGLVCAACHVRGWQRYGPPRRDGSLEASPEGSPHGGVIRTTYFEDARFCSGCHQFAFPAPNGKSLQNTYEEWKASRYAEDGISCQTCHMPERRHLWRGVHDSTMVASGITIEWMSGSRSGVGLRITNSGTGHRFPTYVTPEVVVRVELLDADASPIEGAQTEAWIRRKVEARGGVWAEVSDTRLPPDSSLTVTVPVAGARARFARGSVVVYPDAFYEGVFEGLLGASLSDTSRALITEAHRRTRESAISVFDDTVRIGTR